MSLTIDLYANDGSPLGITPPDIYHRGVGGAELSMMTWAERMTARGHDVRVYNDPKQAGVYHGVEYLPQRAFESASYRDVFIVFRSPNPHIQSANAGLKVHWSTDQHTMGDYSRDIVPYVDKIVCISPFHVDYYRNRYAAPEEKLTYIDLGVRLEDYQEEVAKVKNRFIFCSVPERGLSVVRQIWPEIREQLPDATLVITSDHRLWGSVSPRNRRYRRNFMDCDGVVFLGAIPRSDLVEHQQQAQIHLYPCIYPELFCISVAECQVAGAYPVTTDFGALKTTNEFGKIIEGHPRDRRWQKEYVEYVIGLVRDQDKLIALAEGAKKVARERFHWNRILDEWLTLMCH